nr:7613_t:CDS:2 [Entrophospora candida]
MSNNDNMDITIDGDGNVGGENDQDSTVSITIEKMGKVIIDEAKGESNINAIEK